MARVFRRGEGKRLELPGRDSREIVSGEVGSHAATLRVVKISPHAPGDPQRLPHSHNDVEECIYVLSGRGTTQTDSGEFALDAGDTLWIPAGEKHVTRNTGGEPLVLLCFFPSADIQPGIHEEPPHRRITSEP